MYFPTRNGTISSEDIIRKDSESMSHPVIIFLFSGIFTLHFNISSASILSYQKTSSKLAKKSLAILFHTGKVSVLTPYLFTKPWPLFPVP